MQALSLLATQNIPFFFFTDFEGDHLHYYTLDRLEKEQIFFDFSNTKKIHDLFLTPKANSLNAYLLTIEKIKEAIRNGDTYVLNYTQATPITTSSTLKAIFENANAPYKMLFKDRFVCFSPEPFITIKGTTIATYPMKGTINAAIDNAQEIILADEKEMAEHIMIVDLLRNDLSQVASNVKVARFRYTQTIHAGNKKLIQVSSQIEGTLPSNWREELDTIIKTLLPAGSISGAPKKSTVEHIKRLEAYDRGYFTGIMGYYDGTDLETAVMIRFIEQTPQGLVYKSGGGITIDSDAHKEYQELLDKIYIP